MRQNKKLLLSSLIFIALILGVVLTIIALGAKDANQDAAFTFAPVISITVPDVDENEDGINDYFGQEFEVKFRRLLGSGNKCTSSDSARLVVDRRGSVTQARPSVRLMQHSVVAGTRCDYFAEFPSLVGVLGLQSGANRQINADSPEAVADYKPAIVFEPKVVIIVPEADDDEDGINDYSRKQFNIDFVGSASPDAGCNSRSALLEVDDEGSVSLAESELPIRLIDRPFGTEERCQYLVLLSNPAGGLGLYPGFTPGINAGTPVVAAAYEPVTTFQPIVRLSVPQVDDNGDGINDYSGKPLLMLFDPVLDFPDGCNIEIAVLEVDDAGSVSMKSSFASRPVGTPLSLAVDGEDAVFLATDKSVASLIDRPFETATKCEYSVEFEDPNEVLFVPPDTSHRINSDAPVVRAAFQPLRASEPPVTTTTTTIAPSITTAPPPATTSTALSSNTTPDNVDQAGTTVTVLGPRDLVEEPGSLQDALDVFGNRTGIDIQYYGVGDFFEQITAQVIAGNPPDIAMFVNPLRFADFVSDGYILPLPDNVKATAEANWSAAWNELGFVDGVQYAVPTKADIKSLVWYQPARFEANGYEVPQTWDEFKALVDEMIANGDTPLCVGIESDFATGWVFTDWVEDLMLRFHTTDDYDSWIAGDLAFSSPEVRQAWNEVLDLWNTEGAVFAAEGSIASTPFYANADPLINGDCFMHRQASFFSASMPVGTPFADDSENAVDVFYFPSVRGDHPILIAGTMAAAFADRPEVWAVMEYLATSEYASERQKSLKARTGNQISGFLSAAKNQELNYYSPLERSIIEILTTADVARFDASDLMPLDVSAGTFWTEGTSAVNGDSSVEEATAAIDASWPR